MKRKNIIKFVSLLGMGSFVMLAAASCTQAISLVPNSSSSSNSENPSNTTLNKNTNSNSGAEMNDAPSGGTEANNVDQQLAAARQVLTTLIDSETNNISLYADYAKIKATLTSAYSTSKSTLDNENATVEQVKNATSTLQTAIDTAANNKRTFDSANQPLVTAYNSLKLTVKNENNVLGGLTETYFETIKNNLTTLYESGKTLTNQPLETMDGSVTLKAEDVAGANTKITDALSKLNDWKSNAETLSTGFLKEVLDKTKLTGVDSSNQQQPGNYSFVGYSVDVGTGTSGSDRPNWSFAQRKAWTSNTAILNQTQPVSDVSWIYSLTGTDGKYTLTFNNYGPSTGYLYFPYKLIKTSDNVGLQYKLNNKEAQTVEFKPATQSAGTSRATEAAPPMALENADPAMNQTATMNETPTVADINVAKIKLTDLIFGQNTVEFSVPTMNGESASKVAPLIGNMYITSSDDETNKNKIYDSIFGNTLSEDNNQKSVSVDLLKGYGLAANYSMLFYQLTNPRSTNSAQISSPAYFVGFIGGNQSRLGTITDTVMRMYPNFNSTPSGTNLDGDHRTYTIYVNAPQAGNYSISGSYIFSSSMANATRSIRFYKDNDSTHAVDFIANKQADWNTVGNFNTMDNMTTARSSTNSNKTLSLQKGLNKILLAGINTGDTPYIGNLTFTLNSAAQGDAVATASTSGSSQS
ncbi:FIVAR domain-containing protein [Mycoplasma tullyi]|uniref:FIVAR domain-containing protein n=1 Tax=Mycoplasma tullyi TaxID=1612150 RepID=A0A7D7U5S2_9MOLU|nr:FIVAR domain-containing protein [Mycoplasma tullyi]QMT98428.1 FIVAR domain-containing protein [Mycoplasma tullyi]